MSTTTEKAEIFRNASSVCFDDGFQRQEYRVLADGTIEEGTASCRSGDWVGPVDGDRHWNWTAWADAKKVVSASKSSMGEGRFYQAMPAEIRKLVFARYKLVAAQSFPCAAHRDGCRQTVNRKGAYCSQCKHDA